MDNTQIKQDIDNININVETPSDDSDTNLQELERDNWGRILNNKTFKTMKENFRLIKTSFNNFISNVTNEINSLVNKTNTLENNVNTIQTTVNNLETDRDSIETLINDNVSGELNIGTTERVMNLITKDNLKINGNEFSVPQVSDSPFKEFQCKSILRSTLPLTDSSQAGNNEVRQVTFDREFSKTPFIFVNLVRDTKVFSIVSLYNITTTGFKISLNYAGGDCQVQYIAFTLKD